MEEPTQEKMEFVSLAEATEANAELIEQRSASDAKVESLESELAAKNEEIVQLQEAFNTAQTHIKGVEAEKAELSQRAEQAEENGYRKAAHEAALSREEDVVEQGAETETPKNVLEQWQAMSDDTLDAKVAKQHFLAANATEIHRLSKLA